MQTVSDKQTILRWTTWIKEIVHDVGMILDSRATFDGYIEIVKRNPDVQNPSHFHTWVKRNYSDSVVMVIRRHLDKTKKTKSLIKLLEEIQRKPYILTRKWHRTIYDTLGEGYADSDFDRLAGAGEIFDKKIVKEDLSKIAELGHRIDTYANDHLAHRSHNPTKDIPNYNDLNALIDEFEKIVSRYIELFTGSHYTTLKPELQYDWESIFLIAWIVR